MVERLRTVLIDKGWDLLDNKKDVLGDERPDCDVEFQIGLTSVAMGQMINL